MTEAYDESYQRKLLIAVCLATVITPLMSTMMNLSLISIGEDFGVGSHAQAYVNTVFLLGSVVSMVPAAKFASIRGMKKVFLLGLCICMGASILSILSPEFWFLLLMRFTIGFGSAMLAVTSVAMLTYIFPVTHRGKVLGINTTFVYLALSVGPTIGGVITDTLGWRAIFGLIFILSLGAAAYMVRLEGEIIPMPGEGKADLLMEMSRSVYCIRERIDEPELLAQLAEESAELAQAALKYRRTLTGENPTPMGRKEAAANMIEEMADVDLCVSLLTRPGDPAQREMIERAKLLRWESRLKDNG